MWERLFPAREIYARTLTLKQQAAIFAGLALAFGVGGHFIPADGFMGFDWVVIFKPHGVPAFYPPWGNLVVNALSWPALVGLGLAAVCLAALKRAVHPASLAAVLLTLPLLWTLFLGQLEGLITLGLLGLPWLAPLALLKPQVSMFAFGARRTWLMAGLVVLGVSLVIWGAWPLRMLNPAPYLEVARFEADISLGLWGVVLALPLLWASRGDMDMLMLAGAFMTLHLIPFNLLPVMPAIARLPPRAAWLVAALTWLPFSANWIGQVGWWLGWASVICLWAMLAWRRYYSSPKS